MTINELFEVVWHYHWERPKFINSRHVVEVARNFKNHIQPTFGESTIEDLTPKMVRHWLATFEKTPYAGNRSLEVLSKMYTVAQQEELLPQDFNNPCGLVDALPERKRDRYASEDEVKRIIDILKRKSVNSPVESALIFTLMYTGARPQSIVTAKRSDLVCLKMNDGLWCKLSFDGKSTNSTGKKEVLLFPPFVTEKIFAIPDPKDGTLFGIKFPRKFWENVRIEAGCKDLWARDLRRTFATMGLSNGVNIDAIGEVLNHQSAQTTKIYAKLNDASRMNVVRTVASSYTAEALKPST